MSADFTILCVFLAVLSRSAVLLYGYVWLKTASTANQDSQNFYKLTVIAPSFYLLYPLNFGVKVLNSYLVPHRNEYNAFILT